MQSVGPSGWTHNAPGLVTLRLQTRPLSPQLMSRLSVPAATLTMLQDPEAGVGAPGLCLQPPLTPHRHHHHPLHLGQGDTHQAWKGNGVVKLFILISDLFDTLQSTSLQSPCLAPYSQAYSQIAPPWGQGIVSWRKHCSAMQRVSRRCDKEGKTTRIVKCLANK